MNATQGFTAAFQSGIMTSAYEMVTCPTPHVNRLTHIRCHGQIFCHMLCITRSQVPAGGSRFSLVSHASPHTTDTILCGLRLGERCRFSTVSKDAHRAERSHTFSVHSASHTLRTGKKHPSHLSSARRLATAHKEGARSSTTICKRQYGKGQMQRAGSRSKQPAWSPPN